MICKKNRKGREGTVGSFIIYNSDEKCSERIRKHEEDQMFLITVATFYM